MNKFKLKFFVINICIIAALCLSGCSKTQKSDSSNETDDSATGITTDSMGTHSMGDSGSDSENSTDTINTDSAGDTDSAECISDTSRCHGDTIQKCTNKVWIDWTECAIQNLTCAMIQGLPTCYKITKTDTGSDSDSAADTGSDSDSVADTGSDSAADTGSDSATDTGSDSAADTGSDSAADTGSDSVTDTDWGIEPPPVPTGVQSGYATRYWDCCKPHCSWSDYFGASNGTPSCSQSNVSQGIDGDIMSACTGVDAYACWNLTPWAVGSKLSYGYAGVPATGDICGKCYQLYFTSGQVIGKTMIVQAVNIGYDANGGQFDIQIPGGGVGAYNACSQQWGIASSSLGAAYGGFLTTCKSTYGTGASTSILQTCVMDKCNSIFGATGREDLLAGCKWFVEWFEVSDNPKLIYKEITCPAAITANSGMSR